MTKLSLCILFYILLILCTVFCAPYVKYNPDSQEVCNAPINRKNMVKEAAIGEKLKIKNKEAPNDYEEEEENDGDLKSQGVRSKKQTKLWDHWGKWSPCSVSCGVGKMTRWRHCISEGCAPGEKEAQIKTCTLANC